MLQVEIFYLGFFYRNLPESLAEYKISVEVYNLD